jgi:glycosyltransferase involved in cell wall biosynthesis
VQLECAGDGDLEAVADYAGRGGVRSRVNLRGWIDPTARSELLARATVFVLPSHAEGLPVSLLEAMGAGCAVIASDVGGIPDVIVNGVNGLLVPAGDVAALTAALECVLRDGALAVRLGAQARATVARDHTPALALARLESIYTALGVQRETPARSIASRGMREVA